MARLFEPLTLKSVTTRNRIVISPMPSIPQRKVLPTIGILLISRPLRWEELELSSLKQHSSQTQPPRGLGMATPSSVEISIS